MDNVKEIQTWLHACGCTNLLALLTEVQLRSLLGAPKTHKAQPLTRLVRAAEPGLHCPAGSVLHTTERAIRMIHSRGNLAFQHWLNDRISKAAGPDFEEASAALGEVRAAGTLLEIGTKCHPVRIGPKKTPDFRIEAEGGPLFVEVHTKQLNGEEAKMLAGFRRGEFGRSWTLGADAIREHSIAPGGRPKPQSLETLGENLASKFANIKPHAPQAQADHPNLLWLDLQDEDMEPVPPDATLPVVAGPNGFSSLGLWHAFYGQKNNTPIFEYHVVSLGDQSPVQRLGFDGMFAQTKAWSAVVLTFPRTAVVFEHPDPDSLLPAGLWPMLLTLPFLRFELSVIGWANGDGSVRATVERMARTLDLIMRRG